MSETVGKSTRVGIGVIVIASVVVLALALFLTGFFNPKVEITSSILHRGSSGILGTGNYWVNVEISLYNHGWSGTVTVWAEITYEPTQDTWKKAKAIHLGQRESKDVTIEFTLETGWYFGDFTYRVWLT